MLENGPKRAIVAPTPWLCALSDVGVARTVNEDAFRLDSERSVWVVADGMGGQKAGATASRIAVDAVIESVAADLNLSNRAAAAGVRLRRGLALAHERVLARSGADAKCRGMGSAIVAGLLIDDVLHVAHAGDTRAYLFHDTALTRLTVDHSAVAARVLNGDLTWEEARSHPARNRLRQAVGVRHGFEPDIVSASVACDDRVLLCSDGLWGMLADAEIASILGSDLSVLQMAQILTNRALAAGGRDNITLVLYAHGGTRPPSFG